MSSLPQYYRVVRKSDGAVIAEHAVKAASVWQRVIGLMFRKSLPEGEALWIIPCNGVHTWFMRFPIDMVTLDKDLKVVAIRRSMKPWRMAMPVKGGHSVLELEAGCAATLKPGDICILSLRMLIAANERE